MSPDKIRLGPWPTELPVITDYVRADIADRYAETISHHAAKFAQAHILLMRACKSLGREIITLDEADTFLTQIEQPTKEPT